MYLNVAARAMNRSRRRRRTHAHACVTTQELLYRSSYFGAAGATLAPQQLLLHSMVPLLLATAYALATTVMSNYGKHYNTINTGFL